jgi:hypothetical protein
MAVPASLVVSETRRRAVYEDWRPPVIGVALLIPVGAGCLAVADLQGLLMLPVGGVFGQQTPMEAASRVLFGPPGDLRLLRRVAVDWVQTRRRKVITHVMATAPLTPDNVERLIYRDARARVRVMATHQFVDQVWPGVRPRILVGLQALATGTTAYLAGGIVQPLLPPELAAHC